MAKCNILQYETTFHQGFPSDSCSYGHLPVITGYFNGIIHSINGVSSVLITDKWP